MSRKGENIYKRKDGRWEGRYIKSRSINGKATYGYIYAKTYSEVKQRLALAKAGNLESNSQTSSHIPFKHWADEWLISIQPRIKESSNIKYNNLLQKYVLPILGDKELSQLSHCYIQNYCNELLANGGRNKKGLSPKTVADILSLLRCILRFSAERTQCPVCDAKNIIIKQKTTKMKILSRDEQAKLCKFLFKYPSCKNIGILMCLFTGMRIGEVCALKWKDISLSEKIVYVNKTMQRIQNSNGTERKTKIVITQPKSSCSIRAIPLPDTIVDILSINQQTDKCYVLTGKENIYIEPRNMQYHFKKVLNQCDMDSFSFHSLRHTFATRCVEVGFDVKSLSEILGHASINITMNRYVHPSMDLKRENMNLLSALISVK